jgi:hypothetical protein
MERVHVAIVTIALSALPVFGARRALGQGQARLFDDFERGPSSSTSVESRGSSALTTLGRVPLAFVENRGQFDARACFVARRGGMTAYFTREGFVLQLVSRGPERHSPMDLRCRPESSADADVCGASVFLTFVGASNDVVVQGVGALQGRYNYFLGNDPSRWRANVPAYASIRYRGLYPGVDVEIEEHESRLEYDLTLEPGADLDQVVIRCEGAEALHLDESGALVLETATGSLQQLRPRTYQIGPAGERLPVDCSFRILGDACFAFEVAGRRGDLPLVVDPGLVYSAFLGGTGYDKGTALALDAAGAAVVGGFTWSSDFPTTPGAYDTTQNGSSDAFVTKLDASGSTLLYSTFLGGSGVDELYAIALDATGAAVLTGWTLSSNFPTTTGAYDTTYGGGFDGFVTKLDATGGTLLYSTLLGGSDTDIGYVLAFDAAGDTVVAGWSSSSDFPATPGAYDTKHNGGQDGFVAKLNAAGSKLIYATFLGGSGTEGIFGLTLDGAGAPIVVGGTASSDFPTTPGAYDTTFSGGDGFVAKLDSSASTLLYSTFLGGSDDENAENVVLDSAGAVIVSGWTLSSDFPTTPGAYDTTYGGGRDITLSKLDPSGSTLLYSTFLGGSGEELTVKTLALDSTGAIVLSGRTSSADFPTTPGAYDTTQNGNHDVFVAKLDLASSTLLYSTFLGGSGDEQAGRLVLDAAGAAVVSGETSSSNFPTTPGAYDTTYNGGGNDVFLAKLELVAGGCSGDLGFTLTVPSEAPIGEFIDICTSAPAGDLIALLASLGQGPTVTKFGTFCLDFPPLVLFTFVMPGSGSRCFHRYVTCTPDLVGVTGYLQFVALTPGGGVDGLSNQSPVTVVDHGACG